MTITTNMTADLVSSLALREISTSIYETIHPPDRMGNSAPIAYGGCTAAVAVHAAHQHLPANFHLYSALGNFLAPALTDRTLKCTVHELRRTRAFVTRSVELSQKHDNGTSRICLIVLVDFHAAEPNTLLEFSTPPIMQYSSPEDTLDAETAREELYASGELSRKAMQTGFGLLERYWEQRAPRESINAQHHNILAKTKPTSQDHLAVTDKTTALWLKLKHTLSTSTEHAVALAWIQDAGLSFLPLVHSKMWLDDAAACGTLEFSLRVFSSNINLNEWCLRESRCVGGGEGRSFSEARMWDRSGRLLSSCTQQSILRPWPSATGAKI